MGAVARGARPGGLTVGILHGPRHADANPFVDIIIVIVTGFGEARNAAIARSAHALVALAARAHGAPAAVRP